MKGAEPYSHDGGAAGALVLHGFTGNPQALRPVAEALAAAGFTVELPLLPGHGTHVEDMLETGWKDWSGAAAEAFAGLEKRCDELVVVGLSAGGAITCWLAEQHPAIRCIAVVNPMIDPPAQSFRDVIAGVLEAGETLAPGVGSDIAMPGVSELAYSGTPLRPALSLFEGLDAVAADLAKNLVSVPDLYELPGPRRPAGLLGSTAQFRQRSRRADRARTELSRRDH